MIFDVLRRGKEISVAAMKALAGRTEVRAKAVPFSRKKGGRNRSIERASPGGLGEAGRARVAGWLSPDPQGSKGA
jgi:hypothetical protein